MQPSSGLAPRQSRQYDIARDGRFLFNVAVDDYAQPPISVVLNWDALLKK